MLIRVMAACQKPVAMPTALLFVAEINNPHRGFAWLRSPTSLSALRFPPGSWRSRLGLPYLGEKNVADIMPVRHKR